MRIPEQQPTPVVSVRPVVLPAPARGTDLQVRVTAPLSGSGLPIVVFAHGFGANMDMYAPLVEHWAAHGFAVLQPTHLDSRTLAVGPDDPRYPEIWRIRVADLVQVLDSLDTIEAVVPGLAGRLDHDRIAVAGHSWGGQTASMLLGARVLDADGTQGEDMSDPRVKAGVLLATTGTGGADLTPFAADHFPFMSPTFAQMTTPTLVVAGDQDKSHLSVRGPDWFTDPYHLSPGPKSLLVVSGGEHSLGGIPGHNVTETTDESPERVALVQRATTAYLRSALIPGDPAWSQVDPGALGRIESR
ncbi:alpha/beta fold hydrolase [Verrucosispora sp. WMMA2044]|uniref:alpha/beta hydrolase family protein n=1 Tax=Verrucosispora sp. WMMA2044 TaxID=3016419 RepID=UPI00248AE05E|nr:alpha/beta fold hydrolase [Verrucosispora sp. WMMA2044]WBB47421.1 alpha/beta fold hydrolase [Verrucosispora sp. WMMA2044]